MFPSEKSLHTYYVSRLGICYRLIAHEKAFHVVCHTFVYCAVQLQSHSIIVLDLLIEEYKFTMMILLGSLQGIFHTALYHVLIGSYMVIYQTTSVQFKRDRCAAQTHIVKCKILYMSVYLFEFLFGIHV